MPLNLVFKMPFNLAFKMPFNLAFQMSLNLSFKMPCNAIQCHSINSRCRSILYSCTPACYGRDFEGTRCCWTFPQPAFLPSLLPLCAAPHGPQPTIPPFFIHLFSLPPCRAPAFANRFLMRIWQFPSVPPRASPSATTAFPPPNPRRLSSPPEPRRSLPNPRPSHSITRL